MTEEEYARYFRQGVRRLLDWMPACRARALGPMADTGAGFHADSLVAKAQRPHIREKNLGALIIWPGEKGGWIADLVLRNLPPGVSNTLGTPVQSPHATREQAEEAGRRLLETVLLVAHENEKTPEPKLEEKDIVFELYGYAFKLPGSAFSKALEIMPEMAYGYGTRMHAEERIQAILAVVLPGVDYATFDFSSLSRDQVIRICAGGLLGAALAGMFRYPVPDAKAPGQ